MVELTNDLLLGKVIKKSDILMAFPFLQAVKAAYAEVENCPICQRGAKGDQLNKAVATAKKHLAQMNAADKSKFKEMLGVDSLLVFYPDSVNGLFVRQRVTL